MSTDEKNCLFCKIISGLIPTKIVFENEDAVVFADIAPKAEQHVLVVPREHFASLADATDAHVDLLGKLLLVVRDVARHLGIEDAFQVKIYNGEKAGQTVFHLHIHVLGGWGKSQHH